MPDVEDVAHYFLELEGDAGEISNLKLQKLVYYAQGFSLALRGQPLFDAAIEAWMHGPVVPGLYRRFRDYGSNPIPPSAEFDSSVLSADERHLIEEVFDVYGSTQPGSSVSSPMKKILGAKTMLRASTVARFHQRVVDQLIPDTKLSFSSATAGASPSLN